MHLIIALERILGKGVEGPMNTLEFFDLERKVVTRNSG
jgi:hypothetical protein